MTRTQQLLTTFALICAAMIGRTDAAEVSIQVSTRETYVGVPVTVRISIDNAEGQSDIIFPDIPGAVVRKVGGPNRSSQISIINGRTTQHVTDSYDYQLIPKVAGRIRIPAITVQADGNEYKTKPVIIVVSKSDTGDLLFVELKGNRKSLYIGESLDVTLQIWLRPYLDRQHRVKLSESDMWSRIDVQNSQWAVFQDTLQEMFSRRRRPQGREMMHKDSEGNERSYYLYELTYTFWPQRSGSLDPGDINIVVSYPTQLERNRSWLSMNDLVIADTRPLSTQVEVDPIEVKEIPTAGRPAFYRGAVGRYEISASAKPTEVAVGDPITLTLNITGTGRLDLLQPPPLAELPELTRDFKVPTDPLAGEVQGNRKQFSQSIRAKSDEVKEIPAIPFAYFDPQRETFVTAHTQSIALTVQPAAKLSATQIVDANTGKAIARSLTEVTGGILANYTGMDEVLTQQSFTPGWSSAWAAGLGPIVFALTWLVQRHRERLRNDMSFVRKRSAKRNAIARIHNARGSKSKALAASLSAAICGYIADRCNVPTGGLTRSAVVEQLNRRGVNSKLVDDIDMLLEACESMQYAGGDQTDKEVFTEAAKRCIHRLERERW